jgi:hypothetical protein
LLTRLSFIVGPETAETVAAVSEGKSTYHVEVRTAEMVATAVAL